MNIETIFEKYIKLRKKLDQGKIYKIIDNTNDNIYIGSTCRALKQRLSEHKRSYRQFLKGLCRNVRSFEILENNDYKIELLEDCKVKTKDELESRERFYIENNECTNKNIPGRTKKEYRDANKDKIRENRKECRDANKDKIREYRDANKDKIREYKKEYRYANKDKIREYKKEYRDANKDKINEKFECLCGSQYIHRHKTRNLKTKNYQKYIQSII